MLNFHLMRYSYSKVATFGVLYVPEGWQCFTMEMPVCIDAKPRAFKHALPGGTYKIAPPGGDKGVPAYPGIYADAGNLVGVVTNEYNPSHVNGGIAVSYGVKLEAPGLVPSSLALLHLIEHLRSYPGASVTIGSLPGLDARILALRERVLA